MPTSLKVGSLKTVYVLVGATQFVISIFYVVLMIPTLALIGLVLAPTGGAVMAYGLWWAKSHPNVSS